MEAVEYSTFCCRTDELSKSPSNDSLASYEGPKFGEPGKPGTRDLDFSLKKRGIRREVRFFVFVGFVIIILFMV